MPATETMRMLGALAGMTTPGVDIVTRGVGVPKLTENKFNEVRSKASSRTKPPPPCAPVELPPPLAPIRKVPMILLATSLTAPPEQPAPPTREPIPLPPLASILKIPVSGAEKSMVPELAIRSAPPPPPPPPPVTLPATAPRPPSPPPPEPPINGMRVGSPYLGPPSPTTALLSELLPGRPGVAKPPPPPTPNTPAVFEIGPPAPPPGPSPPTPAEDRVGTPPGPPVPPLKPPGPPAPPNPTVPTAPDMSIAPEIVTLPLARIVTGVFRALREKRIVTPEGMLMVVKLKTPLSGRIKV